MCVRVGNGSVGASRRRRSGACPACGGAAGVQARPGPAREPTPPATPAAAQLTEARGVVVARGLGVAKRLQQRVGLQHLLFRGGAGSWLAAGSASRWCVTPEPCCSLQARQRCHRISRAPAGPSQARACSSIGAASSPLPWWCPCPCAAPPLPVRPTPAPPSAEASAAWWLGSARCARYCMTSLALSVLPAPDSPLRGVAEALKQAGEASG